MSNYRNRKDRGQCCSCLNQAVPGEVRCQQCKDKNKKTWKANRDKINARRRELYFQETLERERRLEEIDERLKQEIAELEKIIPTVCCECGGSGKLDYGFGETSCPTCNSLDTTIVKH